ncbi:MAG: penicillin-binding transpeptidase domain-containing protein [Tissierellia bacterium]|nr:penicillin-binding transpeptidase domain-containing protein [Tissierellia bacterium]
MRKSNSRYSNESNKNIRRFIYFVAFLFLIYISWLAYLQIFDVNMYREKGDKKIISKSIIHQERGTIYDRNNKPLAANLNFNTAYISQAITKNEKQKLLEEEKLINKRDRTKLELLEKYEARTSLPEYSIDEVEKMASILGIDSDMVLRKLKKNIAGPIAFKVDDKKKEAVEKMNLGYVSFYTDSERFYPNKDISASTIGFVENSKGLYGLEKQYDDILSGKKGYAEYYKAVGGTKLDFESDVKINGEKAKNIVTTLDSNVQKLVHDQLVEVFKDNKPTYATAIVSDPNTGEILAMESLPSFDANNPRELNSDIDKLFLEVLDKDKISEYTISRWNNLNVSSIYEPGSTFKSITTSIALDSTRLVEDKHYFCSGSIEIAPGVVINCWRAHDPHGDQSLMEAFSNSCNPAYVGIIDDIGREKFVSYGNGFKYGQKTGIDLPNEIAGYFPKDTDIANVDFRPMSYGHSLSTTPIQQLSALNATINGGVYYRPHILKSIVDDDNKLIESVPNLAVTRVVSEATSAIMRTYYENNSKDSYAFRDDKLRIGHKSGTTVVIKSNNVFDEDLTDRKGMNIISNFAMYPSNAPKYSLLIVVANSLNYDFGSDLGGFINNVFKGMEEMDMKNKVTDIKDKELIRVPDITGLSIAEAKEELRKLGLSLDYDESKMSYFNIITQQSPEPDGYIEKKASIKLMEVDKTNIIAPNLVDMKKEDAIKFLKDQKIKFDLAGQGDTIKEQLPKASSQMKISEKIRLKTN